MYQKVITMTFGDKKMLEMYSPLLGKSGNELNLLTAGGGFKRVLNFTLRVRLLLFTTQGTLLGLARKGKNWCMGAWARNIGLRVAGLLTDYPIPILFPMGVFLNLNRVLVTVHIALLLGNLMHVPRMFGGLQQRSDRGGRFSLNQRR